MIHKELMIRYSGVLSALKIIKIYNAFIIIMALLSLFFFSGELLLLAYLFTLNCVLNYTFFKRMCEYLENLNSFFDSDKNNLERI